MKFCRTYQRHLSFRRLCDILRNHIGTIMKYQVVQRERDTGCVLTDLL